jgi:hypothetical protein
MWHRPIIYVHLYFYYTVFFRWLPNFAEFRELLVFRRTLQAKCFTCRVPCWVAGNIVIGDNKNWLSMSGIKHRVHVVLSAWNRSAILITSLHIFG